MIPVKIERTIQSDVYSFLHTNEHLNGRIVLLTLGGSYAYGTNTETSDIDLRGIALNSRNDILGMSNFEQFENKETDTVIYSFNKIIPLLCNCNPNVIEMLGCRPEQYFNLTEIGKQLIENRKMFLSKRAIHSFGGYATAQLRRLENAIARDKLPQSKQEQHILGSMKNTLYDCEQRYPSFHGGEFALYVDDSDREDMEKEIFCDISLTHYPARELNGICNELTNTIRTYNKLNNRNKKKDDEHLNKHAMHLIRLYLMCLDILENEEIVTYREKEHDLLMSIRNGAYQNEDGTYRSEFFDMVSDFEKRMEYAAENTSLPNKPNMKKIEEFVIEVNRKSLEV